MKTIFEKFIPIRNTPFEFLLETFVYFWLHFCYFLCATTTRYRCHFLTSHTLFIGTPYVGSKVYGDSFCARRVYNKLISENFTVQYSESPQKKRPQNLLCNRVQINEWQFSLSSPFACFYVSHFFLFRWLRVKIPSGNFCFSK